MSFSGESAWIELMMSGLRAISVPGLDSLPRQLGGSLSRQQFCRSSQDLGNIRVFLLVSLLIFDPGVLGVSLLFLCCPDVVFFYTCCCLSGQYYWRCVT